LHKSTVFIYAVQYTEYRNEQYVRIMQYNMASLRIPEDKMPHKLL